jgi:hypothetical protein
MRKSSTSMYVWEGGLDQEIGGTLCVGCGFGLQKDWDAIANGIGEAAMWAPEGGVGFGRKRAFADGTRDEIEEVLRDHEYHFTCEGAAEELLVLVV